MPFWNRKRKDEFEAIVRAEYGEIPDFEAMSVDELIEYKVQNKQVIKAIRERSRIAHVVYTRKLLEWHAQEALKRVGLEGIVVTPGPALLHLHGQENNADTN